MNISDKYTELETALKTVADRVYIELGGTIDVPAMVIYPPAITWEDYNDEPSTLTFHVGVAVKKSDTLVADLLAQLDLAVDAIENHTGGVLKDAFLSLLPFANGEFPGYVLSVDF